LLWAFYLGIFPILARTACAAMCKSGGKFRTRANDDGTLERWQQPKLPAWEVPKRNPHEQRPRAPDWEPKAAEIAGKAAAAEAGQKQTSRLGFRGYER
jgi:hypothetical protein